MCADRSTRCEQLVREERVMCTLSIQSHSGMGVGDKKVLYRQARIIQITVSQRYCATTKRQNLDSASANELRPGTSSDQGLERSRAIYLVV